MKKTITIATLCLSSLITFGQSLVESFESFSLSPSSAYTNSNNVAFTGNGTTYPHTEGGGFWTGGWAYTNIQDSATAGFTNLYGVKALKGYNNSNQYVVGQNNAILNLNSGSKGIEGFYVTNTTYAYKSMLLGDAFAKKFGGASGNDSDFFKMTIKGYSGGNLKTDSVEFYLANFTFTNNAQDYIVNTWQWVNTISLGEVDSLVFQLFSSDNGSFGMNTPGFFALDNVTASPSFVGLGELTSSLNITIYPNPTKDYLKINSSIETAFITISDYTGKSVKQINYTNGEKIDLSDLQTGIYFIEFISGESRYQTKLIKE